MFFENVFENGFWNVLKADVSRNFFYLSKMVDADFSGIWLADSYNQWRIEKSFNQNDVLGRLVKMILKMNILKT